MTRPIRLASLKGFAARCKRPATLADVTKPKRAPRRDREGPVQEAIVAMIVAEFVVDVYSTLNGAKLSHKVRAKMKREGLTRGIVDLHLDWDTDDGWLEVKLPGYTPSDVTAEQRRFIDRKRAKGRNAAIVSTVEAARSTLILWGVPRKAAA